MTNPVSIISTDLVLLDVDAGADKESVIGRLAGRLAESGRVTDRDELKAAALAREAQSATGLPGGIAIPHCRSAAVSTPSIGFARLSPKVDFGAPDGPADLVFLIAAPDGAGAEHMKLLSSLARALVRPDFVAVAAGGQVRRRHRRTGRRCGQPGRRRPRGRAAAESPGGRSEVGHRDHRLPHRHRPHLHGRRRAQAGRRARGGEPDGGDPGLLGQHAGERGHDRRCRRRHLRHRRRRQGPAAVRREAGDRLRRQAGHQRARQDDRRSRCSIGQSERRREWRAARLPPTRGLRQAGSAGAPGSGRSC